jgi:hypothetical protein
MQMHTSVIDMVMVPNKMPTSIEDVLTPDYGDTSLCQNALQMVEMSKDAV